MSARNAPSRRTLGSQLVAISTVWALIDCMLRTAISPRPDIATSMKTITEMILRRMENLDTTDPDCDLALVRRHATGRHVTASRQLAATRQKFRKRRRP